MIPFCSLKYLLKYLAPIIKYSAMRPDIWRNGYALYWVGCLLSSFREYQENLICDDLAGQGLKISNFCFKNDNIFLVTSWIRVIHISQIAGIIKNRSFSVIFFHQIYLCYFWSKCHRKAIRMYILWATTQGKTLIGWEAGLWVHLRGGAGDMWKGGGNQGERWKKEFWTLGKTKHYYRCWKLEENFSIMTLPLEEF